MLCSLRTQVQPLLRLALTAWTGAGSLVKASFIAEWCGVVVKRPRRMAQAPRRIAQVDDVPPRAHPLLHITYMSCRGISKTSGERIPPCVVTSLRSFRSLWRFILKLSNSSHLLPTTMPHCGAFIDRLLRAKRRKAIGLLGRSALQGLLQKGWECRSALRGHDTKAHFW